VPYHSGVVVNPVGPKYRILAWMGMLKKLALSCFVMEIYFSWVFVDESYA